MSTIVTLTSSVPHRVLGTSKYDIEWKCNLHVNIAQLCLHYSASNQEYIW